jgi:hypothetical protein
MAKKYGDSIHRCEALWRCPWGQHLEISIFPHSKRQWPKAKLCRYPTDWVPPRTSFKPRQRVGHAPAHCNVPPQLRNPPPCLGRAVVLPHVPRIYTPPLRLGGLWRCHASWGSSSCLAIQEGSGAATCPSAPDHASPPRRALMQTSVHQLWTAPHLRGGLRCWHVSHGSSRAMGHRDKERLSCNGM